MVVEKIDYSESEKMEGVIIGCIMYGVILFPKKILVYLTGGEKERSFVKDGRIFGNS